MIHLYMKNYINMQLFNNESFYFNRRYMFIKICPCRHCSFHKKIQNGGLICTKDVNKVTDMFDCSSGGFI